MGHLVTATCTVPLISVHASQEGFFFSQLKIITNFDLKITSQNIVRKEHEQVYYAFLILLAPPDFQTFQQPCTLKCFKHFIKILVKHVTLIVCVPLVMPSRIHQI